LKIKDYNNDGFNDIAFVGKIVFIQGQTKIGDWFDSETKKGKNSFTKTTGTSTLCWRLIDDQRN
jgi:hypothetical protein